MPAVANATPLISLDAVVFDTETTGLDSATARIVEIGAVRLHVGRLTEGAPFRCLVRPDIEIPAEATRVHGIDGLMVAAAPPFAQVWQEFAGYAGDAVLIGHSVGFDMAVLEHECERAGIVRRDAVALDTQLLARVVEPSLVDVSIERVAALVGVDVTGRHSAPGDALTTARIFLALVPHLRERGVRTLAEAVAGCRALGVRPATPHQANWAEPTLVRAAAEPLRIDTYPYRHRVADVMSAPPRSVAPEVPIGEALGIMARQRISSVLVFAAAGAPPIPATSGIVTERDVMRAICEHGAEALRLPVTAAMSHPLVAVPGGAFAYVAIGRMNRLRIRHLGVTDANDEIVGVVSVRDLLRLRSEGAIELGDEIEAAADVHELGRAWGRLAQAAGGLYGEGLPARDIAAVISQQLRETTRRAVELAEHAMRADGLGDPPGPYAFVVLGSAGRGESLLTMDQDNALVYADGEPAARDDWYAELGRRVSDSLHQAGVPYCTGGVMARNAQWRGSVSSWRARVDDWVSRSDPKGLLAVDIFFDLRAVRGDLRMVQNLRRHAFDAAKGDASFAKLLLEAGGPAVAARNWFGRLRAQDGRIDLKRSGLFPLVSAVRALAICHHVTARSTSQRLAEIRKLGLGLDADLEALDEAHVVLLDLVLRHQLDDLEAGRRPGNAVEIRKLTRRDRARLHEALGAVEQVDRIARELLFATPAKT